MPRRRGARAERPSSSARSRAARRAAAAPRSPLRPAASAADDEAEAQAWRAKRASAEAALKQTESRLATLREVAGWCNRGHEVWAEDEDGLRHSVDCEDVDRTERELRREQKRLEAYLGEGLEEECRRAGCLPGWLR